jgi:DNA-binding CsgD family transcriptional regulator
VGFALLLLTDLFALGGGLPLIEIGKLALNDVLIYWTIPHILTMALVFLAVARIFDKLKYAHINRYLLVAGLVMLAGALLLVFQAITGITALWMMVMTAILVAAGSACLLALWEYVFIGFTDEQIVRTVLIALLLSSASYLVVISCPQVVQLVLFPVMICAAVGMLTLTSRRTTRLWYREFSGNQKTAEMASLPPSFPASLHYGSQPRGIARLIRDPLLCVAAIMFAVAITRTVTLSSISNVSLVNIAGCVGTLLGAVLLYAARYVLGDTLGSLKTFNLLRFYRVLFPMLATVLLLLPIFGNQLLLPVSSLVYVGYKVSFVLILPTCMTLARQDGTHPLAVFGVFMAGVHLVFALATGFVIALYHVNYFGAATLTVGILLALYVLAMTYSVAMNIWRRREQEENVEQVPTVDSSAAGSTQAATQAIATEHLLTAREQDVLLLLAQGRDVPTIARQLNISENTVRTHTKNVYIKLDVHGKQELLDRVEEYY